MYYILLRWKNLCCPLKIPLTVPQVACLAQCHLLSASTDNGTNLTSNQLHRYHFAPQQIQSVPCIISWGWIPISYDGLKTAYLGKIICKFSQAFVHAALWMLNVCTRFSSDSFHCTIFAKTPLWQNCAVKQVQSADNNKEWCIVVHFLSKKTINLAKQQNQLNISYSPSYSLLSSIWTLEPFFLWWHKWQEEDWKRWPWCSFTFLSGARPAERISRGNVTQKALLCLREIYIWTLLIIRRND